MLLLQRCCNNIKLIESFVNRFSSTDIFQKDVGKLSLQLF